jgi:hypothetical protein
MPRKNSKRGESKKTPSDMYLFDRTVRVYPILRAPRGFRSFANNPRRFGVRYVYDF